jgi:hypothetical protein
MGPARADGAPHQPHPPIRTRRQSPPGCRNPCSPARTCSR